MSATKDVLIPAKARPALNFLHWSFPRTISVLVMLMGLLVVAGWGWDVELFKRVIPGLVSMNPLTAICFVSAGIALGLRSGFSNQPPARWTSVFFSLCVFAAGFLILIEFLLGEAWQIDQILFRQKLQMDSQAFPNRMAPNTAFNFVLLGLALLLFELITKKGRRPTEILAVVVVINSAFALLGYFYMVQTFYGIGTFIPMAFHTAMAFFLVGFAILCARPNAGFMAVVMGSSPGGLLIRRLLPATVASIAVLGWLRLEGQRRGLYSDAFGVTIYTVTNIVLMGALIIWSGRSLDKADIVRKAAEEDLRRARDELEVRVLERTADLTATEAKFRALVEQSIVGIYIIQDGRFVYVNPKMPEIFGYTTHELTSRPVTDFILEEDQRMASENIRKRIEGAIQHAQYSLRMRHKNGSVLYIEVFGSRSDYNGRTAILGTLLDITEQKNAEIAIKRLNEDLEKRVQDRTQALEFANKELESFSYSVSHDLRAPLRHVHGYVQMLKNATNGQLSSKADRYLNTIAEASVEMGQLIDDLLAFSRMSRTELKEAALNPSEIINEILRNMEMETKGRAISWKIGQLPRIKGDPALLKQVFINLISNAVKYTRERSPAEIEIGSNGLDHDQVVLFVRDNGAGFDMQYAHKLFGVFQRLHRPEEFEGTGIGLAIVRRVIQRHGGRIWAQGALNQGATFYFTLKPA
jgi:PAS domain S-box-containing protein